MKLNKLNCIMVVAMAVYSVSSMAATTDDKPLDQGHGAIKFTGSIITAPCSITPGSSAQTVDLGQISNKALENGGTSTPQPFQIELEKCDLDTIKTVSATFTGAPSVGNPELLGITGDAKGASIALTDGSGALIKFGVATKPMTIMNGSNTLAFSAYLKGDAKGTIVPGGFSSIANYSLSYF